MARVVVVGGGYGGLAVAVRLAKLGHDLTLVEAAETLGGALTTVEADGFAWDAGPWSLSVPAVVRDLFRKSGRPLEGEPDVALAPLDVVREHRFADRTVLRLPGGSRAGQVAAFEGLAPGLGAAWDAHVSSYAPVWDVLRRHYFEEPWTPQALPREVADILDARGSLHRRLRQAFRDHRPAAVAGHPLVADGHDLRDVPAWAGITTYLEQLFGAWRVPDAHGGMARLRDLMVARLATRGVTVHLGTAATDLVLRDGRAAAVATTSGELDADVVVCAVDPRRLPALARHVVRTTPAMPPVVAHVGIAGDLGETGVWTDETVLHGDPLLVVRPGGAAPSGHAALTVHGRGRVAEDLLTALARHGVDLRRRVVARVDRTPSDLVRAWGGSPHGVRWQGRGTVRRRLGPRTPVPNVYAAGAHATPGAGLAHVGLSAALVATVVGPA